MKKPYEEPMLQVLPMATDPVNLSATIGEGDGEEGEGNGGFLPGAW